MNAGKVKEIYEGQGVSAMSIPCDKVLENAASVINFLKSKGQQVEMKFGGGQLHITAQPSNIGIDVQKGSEASYLYYDPCRSDLRDLWRGEFQSWIWKHLRYKDWHVLLDSLEEVWLHELLRKLLDASAKFERLYPKLRKELDRFVKERDKLTVAAAEKVRQIMTEQETSEA